MKKVGNLSFEIVESGEGRQLRVRVVGSSRGCGFDTEAKAGELKRLARYLETPKAWKRGADNRRDHLHTETPRGEIAPAFSSSDVF